MDDLCIHSVQQLLDFLIDGSAFQKIITSSANNYAIKHLKLETITVNQLQQILQKQMEIVRNTNDESNPSTSYQNHQSWGNNQLRIFAWISFCYSSLVKKQISHFNTKDFEFFWMAFPLKSKAFLEYNLKSLSKEANQKRTKWTQQQVQLLQNIMRSECSQFKWTPISFQLYVRSGGEYYRSPQKCREQWINHLNPEVSKEKWTAQQDLILLKSILKIGKRWSNVSKLFSGSRTQHMVKNRYNSIIHKHQSKSKKVSEKKICQKLLINLEQQCGNLQFSFQKSALKLSQVQMTESIMLDCGDFIQRKQQDVSQISFNKSSSIMQMCIEQSVQPEDNYGKCSQIQGLILGETSINVEQNQYSKLNIELKQIQIIQQHNHKIDEEYILSLLA